MPKDFGALRVPAQIMVWSEREPCTQLPFVLFRRPVSAFPASEVATKLAPTSRYTCIKRHTHLISIVAC